DRVVAAGHALQPVEVFEIALQRLLTELLEPDRAHHRGQVAVADHPDRTAVDAGPLVQVVDRGVSADGVQVAPGLTHRLPPARPPSPGAGRSPRRARCRGRTS